MAGFRLTRKADDDLGGIYEYSIANFGLRQARNYLNDCSDASNISASIPRSGLGWSSLQQV